MFTLIQQTAPLNNFQLIENWLTLAIVLGIGLISDIFLFKMFHRVMPRIIILLLEAGLVAAWLFEYKFVSLVIALALTVSLVFFVVANRNDSRDFVANNMAGRSNVRSIFKKGARRAEKLFDREAIYEKISAAVLSMSESQTGAIITIQKKDDLSGVCKNGTMINAPVTTELLQTIFYKGTRLHDGAVIIRDDMIVAAAVAFQPTLTPLSGKYGLRHRAAIGISEHFDAVTIVVSEETGRISITYQGDIEPIAPQDFYKRLSDYMAIVPVDNTQD